MSPLLLAYLACPILLLAYSEQAAFLALAAPGAALLAGVFQGSWMRIAGAAGGAALRDVVVTGLLWAGMLPQTNPDYQFIYAQMACFLAAAGAAVLTTLTPYRGRMVPVMAALGALGGQCAVAWLPPNS